MGERNGATIENQDLADLDLDLAWYAKITGPTGGTVNEWSERMLKIKEQYNAAKVERCLAAERMNDE